MNNARFTSSIGVEMLKVPAGAFLMGSPEGEEGRRPNQRQHEVTLSEDFYLGATPVTQGQYAALTGGHPSDFSDSGSDAPVDSVSWEDANELCRHLTEVDRKRGVLPAECEYRLPSEAHWEYACRAGNPAARYGEPDSIAWYSRNSDYKTHPVGQKQPNDWGFHDMLGNLFEWCREWYHPEFHPDNSTKLPAGPPEHAKRMVRGGSWYNSALGCRAAFREAFGPAHRGRYVGFRLFAGRCEESPIRVRPVVSGFPPDYRQPTPEQELYEAIRKDNISMARRLLAEHEGMADYHDEIPPPLQWAVIHNRPQIVEALVEHGADIERRDMDEDQTALGYAVVYARPTIIKILAARGADFTGKLETAMKGAAGDFEVYDMPREQYVEIVELLRELGAK